jgi:hypothetical protein
VDIDFPTTAQKLVSSKAVCRPTIALSRVRTLLARLYFSGAFMASKLKILSAIIVLLCVSPTLATEFTYKEYAKDAQCAGGSSCVPSWSVLSVYSVASKPCFWYV